MKERLLFLAKYMLFWLAYFVILRLLFLFYHFEKSFSLGFGEWVGIFTNGFRMDLSMVGYIFMLSNVFLSIAFLFSPTFSRRFFKYLTIALLAVFTLVLVIDFELYRHWSFRIDTTPLFYMQNPGEALASQNMWLQLLLLVLAAFIVLGFVKFYIKFPNKQWLSAAKGKWWQVPIFLFLVGFSIIPIRGGFGPATMNPGTVYFSSNMFSNHVALNGIWNLLYAAVNSGKMNRTYPNYISNQKADTIFVKLLEKQSDAPIILNTSTPNVVIILMESFTSKVVETLSGIKGVAPSFDSLTRRGLLFSNIYSASDRSDKGLVAVLAGFPAQSTQSVIKYPFKTAKLPSISSVLDSLGYSTTFYYGGNADFANMRSFLYSSKINRIISEDDFPRSFKRSNWGVHDEYLYQRLLTEIDTAKGPFFKLLFTLSGHEPCNVPIEPKFTGNGFESKFLSAAHYSDIWLGWFFREAAKRNWYKNTLFVILGDHGHRLPGDNDVHERNRFTIPMLWIGGAIDSAGVVPTVGSQTDLAATLLYQLNLNASKFRFSRNLVAPLAKNFAYYTFHDGFGFVDSSSTFIWDHVSQKSILNSPDTSLVMNAFGYFNFCNRYYLGL